MLCYTQDEFDQAFERFDVIDRGVTVSRVGHDAPAPDLDFRSERKVSGKLGERHQDFLPGDLA